MIKFNDNVYLWLHYEYEISDVENWKLMLQRVRSFKILKMMLNDLVCRLMLSSVMKIHLIMNVKITDFKRWNIDFVKRDLRVNRVFINRSIITFAHMTRTWHYIVVYENIELHEDDERHLRWSQILSWKFKKNLMIFIKRSVIQVYANKILISMNLMTVKLTHREFISISFTWLEIYTINDSNFSSVSSSVAIDASINVMIVIDDSTSKHRITAFDSSSKKIKISFNKKIKNDKYFIMSSSENKNQDFKNEVQYISLSKFNELYKNVKEF